MKKKHMLLFVLFAGLLSSCVMSTQQDLQSINSRLEHQDRQIRTLNSQMGLGNSGQSVPGQAEIWAQLQAMRQDLNILRGQAEEMNAAGAAGGEVARLGERVEKLESAARLLSSQLAIELPMLENAAGGEALPAPGAQVAAPPVVEPVRAAPMAGSADMPKNLYDSGTKAFSERRYADAVKIFTDFTNTYPRHNLMSNAYFWQGESYYQLKNYSNAIVAYQQVIENYQGSNKLQSSMLKQGISMYHRGQKDAAKVRLNELIGKYPTSTEAGRAKTFMQKNP